ncbi:hypothetical protein CAPTEDRAFT_157212 [Capitella teleta]|uniref:Transporter n=1 Tax=Capitella teleta TaxID=283909 RepID=R7U339_CAPTE|nr:hypothetical protein CAPTEDRAFT_157212 [Capitella teleta]|eukprot:ELU00760.1 hypothetical protein CAPTEDRAFT_157212 [Capitella teleta]
MQQGGMGAWKICPLFSGIGLTTTVIVFFLNIYYIVVLAWAGYYWIFSFSSVLPWSHCDNEWNTERCHISFDLAGNCSNATLCAVSSVANITDSVDPVIEFWERKILQISPGIDHPDGIVWQLALSLFLVWCLGYLCVWKGIKWTGKVVYFTATFPFLMLFILFIRGVTLDGAADGIKFYLSPDFSRLLDAQVWIDAGTQIFFSYAIALGAMTALGSYNKITNNCYKDCVIISCINSFTSIFAGFVVFSVLGFMAKQQGVSIDQVAESGPGLAFIAYPKAVTQMPFPQIWSALFFFMIMMLGLDSQFVGMEGFTTVVMDCFPQLRKSPRREIFNALYCLVSYLIGLTMVTRGGMYVFQLFDYYAASGMSLLWCCFFECVAIAWVYGASRFYDNIEQMVGFRINPWLRICWTFLAPLVCGGIFVFMWVNFKPVKYNRVYVFPAWAQGLGLTMAFSSMICIPLTCFIKLLTTPGTLKQRLARLRTPILMPSRVPNHWPDAEFLKEVGYHALSHRKQNSVLFGCYQTPRLLILPFMNV